MSDADFERLRKIIYDRSGIWFAESKKYILENRLGRRLRELDIEDYDQYATFMTIGPYREDEFQKMFNAITINETSFFRNAPQLEFYEKQILAPLIKARESTKSLRIWSAACSTGEEPYTLAIIARRSLALRVKEWNVDILGTDISERVIKTAESGRYTNYSMRSTEEADVQKYFTTKDAFYDVRPEVREMVKFEKLNLKDSLAAQKHGKFDVIFCRNVMIYFDQKMRKECIQMFHRMLNDDGVLFIGHSEVINDAQLFTARKEPEAFAYERV